MPITLIELKSIKLQVWMKTISKSFGYKIIYLYKSNRPILVGAVYRPPATTADTDARSELNIEAAYLRNQEMHVLGDFNLNLFDPVYKTHRLVKAFRSLNLIQLVNQVTRPVSSTCLDHTYSTQPSFIAEISVPNIGLSDHLPCFLHENTRKQKDQIHSTIEYRDLKNLNTDELLQYLQCTHGTLRLFSMI